MKYKVFLITFKRLSLKQITQHVLEGEGPTLRYQKHITPLYLNANDDSLSHDSISYL